MTDIISFDLIGFQQTVTLLGRNVKLPNSSEAPPQTDENRMETISPQRRRARRDDSSFFFAAKTPA